MKNLLFLLAVIGLIACTSDTNQDPTPTPDTPENRAELEAYFPPITGEDWETLDPEQLGWCPDKLAELQVLLEDKNTKAFLILKNGRMVAEWYMNGHGQDSLWYWASAGKTLTTYLIGKAQEENLLDIRQPTSDFLGEGWTSLPPAQEQQVTVWHQLTMTAGLDDGVPNSDCTHPECLRYKAEAGTRWSYHNAPYTLLGDVLEAATGESRNQLTRKYLHQTIGMDGGWFPTAGFNIPYFSTARSMARFGLLIQQEGVWNGTKLLGDDAYFRAMITPSQNLNESYGYLWWLNAGETHRLPQTQFLFPSRLIPSAPAEILAALGKNDQKIYVWPSEQLVFIRMGNSSGESVLAASSFDTQLWEKIMDLSCD